MANKWDTCTVYDELNVVFALFGCTAAPPQQTVAESDINNFTLTNWLWTL